MQRSRMRIIGAIAAGILPTLPISGAAQVPVVASKPAIEMFEIKRGCLKPTDQSLQAALEACVAHPAIFSGSDIAGHRVNPATDDLNGLYRIVLTPDAKVQFEAYTRTHVGGQISWSVNGHLLPPMTLLGVIHPGDLSSPRDPMFDKELLKTPDLTEVIRDCSTLRQRHSAVRCS
jgi:hypothetical protein